jgi:hypothetical protein
MDVQGGQFYRVHIRLREVHYARPILILQTSSGIIDICALSTKFELFEPNDLTINKLDSDFLSTGLDETCYLIFRSIRNATPQFFDDAKYLGQVTGEIKRQVENWWGAPLI